MNTKKWEMIRFVDCFKDVTSKAFKIPKEQYLPKGKFPIIDQGKKDIAGYTNIENDLYLDVPAIIFGDHTRIIKYVDYPLFIGADGVKLLRCKIDDINYKYLYYALLSVKIADTGYNRHFKWLKESRIPLPPLEEQKKIAQELDSIQSLIAKRKEQLEKIDLLVKAKFVEMFGDPVANPMGWEVISLNSILTSIESGWSVGGEARPKNENEIGVLKVSAVTTGVFKDDEYKVIANDIPLKKTIFPQKGDLLFSRANTRELVGATCIVNKNYDDLILPDKIWKINNTQNNYYIKFALSSSEARKQMTNNATGTSGSMYNISMDKLKKIKIQLPPIDLQNKFADYVQQTETLKSTMHSGLEKLELLYNSKMQEYFG